MKRITKTLDGIITGWNLAAVRLLGYSEEQAIGQSVTMLFLQGTASEEEQLLKKYRVESGCRRLKPSAFVRTEVGLTSRSLFHRYVTGMGLADR